MSFPNIVHGTEAETLASDTLQRVPVGTKLVIEDGRAFRYCKNNSSNAMIGGNVQVGAIPEVAKYSAQAIATMAAGATVLTAVGATTTNLAIDELVNGYCWTEELAQLGPAMRVKSNTLIDQSSDVGTITLYNPLVDAIASGETISYIRNTWMNVLISDTSISSQPAGVGIVAIAVSVWGWVQVSGPCRVDTSAGDPLVGNIVVTSTETAGNVMPSAAYETDGQAVGIFMASGTGALHGLFFLIIE
jgi:hypothetical protein